MDRNEYAGDEEEAFAGATAEEEEEGRGPGGGFGPAISGAPSWVISGVVHLLLLCLLALIVVGAVTEPPDFRALGLRPQVQPPVEADQPTAASPVPVPASDPRRPPFVAHFRSPEAEIQTKNLVQREIKAKGEELFSDFPLGNIGWSDAIGRGGPPPGSFGDRQGGGLFNSGQTGGSGGGGPGHRGLKWLADHQEPDGHWDCARHGGRADEYASVAVTGLALLAFLGAGYNEEQGLYAGNVRRALDWLQARQGPGGEFSANNYAHNMCALAVAESYGLGGRRGEMAQRAVNYMVAQQKPGGGWDYGDRGEPGRDRNDTSITCWAAMALKAALIGGLEVPGESWRGLERHFLAINAGDSQFEGTLAYAIQDGEVQRGGNAVLAMSMASLQFLGRDRQSPFMIRAAEILREEGPELNNLYKLYYASLAMFNLGGADFWEPWNAGLREPLAAAQVSAPGDDQGSWDPQGDTYGGDGGRVYSTALAVLCLEVHFRYLRVYGE